MNKKTDLLQGTLDLLILRTIALEPMHGWAIAQRIRQMSKDVFQVQQDSLYPALHRLEHKGLIRAEWAESLVGAAPPSLLASLSRDVRSPGNGSMSASINLS